MMNAAITDLPRISIETDRLLLLPVSLEYKEAIFREFQEPVTKFMDVKTPQKIGETERFVQESMQKMRDGTDLPITILDKHTQEFLGGGGLHQLDQKVLKMDIWIKKSAHGHGYGREAIQALKRWADDHIPYEYISYPVVAGNIASRKIAESLNGKIVREYRTTNQSGRTYDYVEYKILRTTMGS